MDLRHFAKILVTQGLNGGLDRQDFERDIAKRAEAIRAPGESREQAFVRYSTTTDDGRLLFKAAMLAPPRQAAQDFPLPKKPEAAGPASRELDELARAMARDKGISFERAHAQLQSDTDPERKALVARVRREEQDAARMIRDQRWPITAAAREYAR
jgi:hypothetical protein